MWRNYCILASVVWFLGLSWTGAQTTADRPAEPEEAAVEELANARAQYDLAVEAENAGDLGRATSAYRTVVRRFPRSEYAERSQLKVGELQEKAGDFQRAFNSYQKLIEDYPNSTEFNRAIEAQFKIATLYLEGERQRVLGIPTLPSMDRARSMFESIVKSAPFSTLAPLAQFNIGLTHERQGDPTQAVAAYQVVIDRYGSSDVADDAYYQIGYVYFTEARKGSYDQATATRARETFEDFLIRYPQSEKTAQAQENLKLLGTKQSTGSLDIAKFYDKQKNYKAAVVYYTEVVQQQPGSEESEIASARIEELRELVGEEELQFGSERAETGGMAAARKRFQAQVDTASRADYAGPAAPIVPDELPPERPRMRTSPADIAPLPSVEPELPTE